MHWVVVVGLVTVLFGKNKISSVMKDLGGGIREFKRGMGEIVGNEEAAPQARQLEDKSDV